jgi:hypothetical protein
MERYQRIRIVMFDDVRRYPSAWARATSVGARHPRSRRRQSGSGNQELSVTCKGRLMDPAGLRDLPDRDRGRVERSN